MASRSSNKAAVPEAKGALDKFKYEVASELGVPLSEGYNGDLTSRQNGSVGGYMVKNMIPELHTPEKPSIFKGVGVRQDLLNITPELHTVFYRGLRSFPGHKMPIEYTYSLAI